MNGTLTKENSFVKNRAKLFASRSEEDALDSPEKKTPSYVSLSCTVSGYSGINRYDSRARQEISRSRDNSRDGRLPLCMAKSRDSSPTRLKKPLFNLSDIPVLNSSPQQMNGRSKSVDRGYLRQNFLNGFSKPPSGPSSQLTSEDRGRNRIRSSTVPNHTGDSKSVIQQRIERLYGPAALAGGFFLLKSPSRPTKEAVKSINNNTITNRDVPDGCQTPPVFRHLNAEFRQQLQVKNKRSPSAALSPSPSPVKPPEEAVIVQEPPKTNGTVQQIEDGHKFLKILEEEKNRIECLIAKNELYLMDSKVEACEELTGKIRAATGKARLLLAQKFEQFAGLCHKNLTQSPDEQFPTTGQDLAGFWDMVMIQVDHVKSMFSEIQKLKENNWVEVLEQVEPAISTTGNRQSKSRNRPPQSTPRSAKAEEAAKVREEARKKMMQDRKRMAKAKKDEDWVITEVTEKTEVVAISVGAIDGVPAI